MPNDNAAELPGFVHKDDYKQRSIELHQQRSRSPQLRHKQSSDVPTHTVPKRLITTSPQPLVDKADTDKATSKRRAASDGPERKRRSPPSRAVSAASSSKADEPLCKFCKNGCPVCLPHLRDDEKDDSSTEDDIDAARLGQKIRDEAVATAQVAGTSTRTITRRCTKDESVDYSDREISTDTDLKTRRQQRQERITSSFPNIPPGMPPMMSPAAARAASHHSPQVSAAADDNDDDDIKLLYGYDSEDGQNHEVTPDGVVTYYGKRSKPCMLCESASPMRWYKCRVCTIWVGASCKKDCWNTHNLCCQKTTCIVEAFKLDKKASRASRSTDEAPVYAVPDPPCRKVVLKKAPEKTTAAEQLTNMLADDESADDADEAAPKSDYRRPLQICRTCDHRFIVGRTACPNCGGTTNTPQGQQFKDQAARAAARSASTFRPRSAQAFLKRLYRDNKTRYSGKVPHWAMEHLMEYKWNTDADFVEVMKKKHLDMDSMKEMDRRARDDDWDLNESDASRMPEQYGEPGSDGKYKYGRRAQGAVIDRSSLTSTTNVRDRWNKRDDRERSPSRSGRQHNADWSNWQRPSTRGN